MKKNYCVLLLMVFPMLGSCEYKKESPLEQRSGLNHLDLQNDKIDSLTIRQAFDTSPILSPEESIEAMEIEKGFEVKLVAAEPLVSTPIALNFDNKGRIWVLEMDAFMPDTDGEGENLPKGKIAILDDKNRDGVMDERKIFLDSLILPRALCLIDEGILVAEPPNLWYYEINGDKPGKKILVDSKYTDGGNVEHQPNGLLRAMDNWIYSAKSNKRYRKKGDKWKIEKTYFRGQWGITQDNYGRLYYNDNSTNLQGDYFMPGFGADYRYKQSIAGFGEIIVPDNRVFPARPTPGVNRGYMEGVLDDKLRLVGFTAASGPVIYRGDLFGEEYMFNSFVAEPAANLIKRNILEEDGYKTEGNQAYEGKEFLASLDERFRPVSLYNGPDGALYIVDMYRGIIQHKTYLSTYLKKEIHSRNLTKPLNYGRIYKVVPKNNGTKAVKMSFDPERLVALLGHTNGWVRNSAQQKLVDENNVHAIPFLRKALNKRKNPLLVTHAIWTLEGMNALKDKEILTLLQEPRWPIRLQALSVIPSALKKTNYSKYLSKLEQLIEESDSLAAPYIGFLAGSFRNFDQTATNNLLQKLVKAYPHNKFVADAVISSLENNEINFQKNLIEKFPDRSFLVVERLNQVLETKMNFQKSQKQEVLKRKYPKGAELFSMACATCHGKDGNGIKSLAPPLNNSEWVSGDKNKLISIVLFGMSGPIEVNGHIYKKPEIAGEMPGIGYDNSISNEEIAQLLSYLRMSWGNNSEKIIPNEVEEIRQKFKDRTGSFTVENLNEIFE